MMKTNVKITGWQEDQMDQLIEVAQKLIYTKMSAVMSEIGAVKKDKKNEAQGFKFRGIDQFVNALHPALIKHGVFLTPKVVSESHELITGSSGKAMKHVHLSVQYNFYAEDGSSVTVGPIVAEGMDSGDKATNKALSAALKYMLIQTFSVPTEDMVDGDADSPSYDSASSRTAPTTFSTTPKLTTSPAAPPTTTSGNVSFGSVETSLAVGSPSTSLPTKRSSFKKKTPAVVDAPAEQTVVANTSSTEEESLWS